MEPREARAIHDATNACRVLCKLLRQRGHDDQALALENALIPAVETAKCLREDDKEMAK